MSKNRIKKLENSELIKKRINRIKLKEKNFVITK